MWVHQFIRKSGGAGQTAEGRVKKIQWDALEHFMQGIRCIHSGTG